MRKMAANRLTRGQRALYKKIAGLYAPGMPPEELAKKALKYVETDRKSFLAPRIKIMKHRGKVSRNPLLMTVGNPNKGEVWFRNFSDRDDFIKTMKRMGIEARKTGYIPGSLASRGSSITVAVDTSDPRVLSVLNNCICMIFDSSGKRINSCHTKKNPLLMTVGNPGLHKSWCHICHKVKSDIEFYHDGICLTGVCLSCHRKQKVSRNPLLMTVGNPCGSKKNPLYAKVGKYGAKATRGFKRSLKSKMPYAVRSAVERLMSKGVKATISGSGIRYAKNDAGLRPLVSGTRTVTIPVAKFEQALYSKGSPSEIRRYEAQKRAYAKAHLGTPPATVTRKIVDVGMSKKITDRDFTYSMGVTPESTYSVPSRSGKAKESKDWKHVWKTKKLHTEVFPGGKVIMNASRGAKLVKQGWMDA